MLAAPAATPLPTANRQHGDTLHLTRHARLRMQQMGVTRDQVWRVLEQPDGRYRSGPKYPHRPIVYLGDGISVVAAHHGGRFTAVTVLWRTGERYDRPDAFSAVENSAS